MAQVEESRDDRTLWVGNLASDKISEEILFELFLQAGPLVDVKIPKDGGGNNKNFAFVEFKHSVSVPYARNLLNNLQLYERPMNIKFRIGSKHTNEQGNMGGRVPTPGMHRSASAPAFSRMHPPGYTAHQFPINGPPHGMTPIYTGHSNNFQKSPVQQWTRSPQNMSPLEMPIQSFQNPYSIGLPVNMQRGPSDVLGRGGSNKRFEDERRIVSFRNDSDSDSRPSSRGSYRDSPGPFQGTYDEESMQRGRDSSRQGNNYQTNDSYRSHKGERHHHRSVSEKGQRSFPPRERNQERGWNWREEGQNRGHHRSRSYREDESYRRDRSYDRLSRR